MTNEVPDIRIVRADDVENGPADDVENGPADKARCAMCARTACRCNPAAIRALLDAVHAHVAGEGDGKDIPPVVVLVDEAQQLFADPGLREQMADIIRNGRQAGVVVHMGVGTGGHPVQFATLEEYERSLKRR